MASLCSSNEKHNFSCVIIACVDFIKLPLKDILASRIKPVNLYKEIDSCPSLKLNRQCCLRSDQRKVCFIKPPDLPNYADFDASLLYKLIRNLCPSLKPTQGWGKEPNPADTDIGDDIERLRLFRNIYFAHASSAAISDTVFKDLWKNLKSVTGRFQLRMGHCGNYKEELIKIECTKFTHDHLQHYKLLLEAFVRLSPEDEVEPDILIEGEEEVTCGDSASFEAEIKPENIGDWLITWRKRIGNDIRCIDTSMEKYRGSTTRKLVIQSVCKEDQGEYRAILSRSSNGNEYRQSKNTICLRVLGDQPLIKDLQVTTGKHCINLLCSYEVLGRSPKVSRIAWSKNGEFLNERVISFAESIISESCYKITSPSNEDKGKYSCTITNAVGSVSEEITLDVPSVEIETDSKVCFGSKTTFRSKVSSIPSPKKVEWQTSKDETDYHCIDIEDPKYYGSNAIPECPLLVIPKTTFDDKLYYRLVVLNKIGGGISNTVKINVTGNLPNISTIQETNIKKKFVKLIGNIFLDDDSPGLLEVFWTKNGKKIDNKGSGGRLSEVTIDDPSLIIKEVCHHDAGPYQLTATNAVGPTKSDEIVLDAPDVSFDKINKEDGSQWFVATIQSIPSPCFVQWSLKSMNDDMFTPIDVNSEDYKGTLNTLPHPVLVVKNSNQFEFNSYQIEVANFVGSTIKNIDDQTPQIQNDKGTQTGIETGVMENPLYREPGSGIKFSKLSDYLAENFPREKLKRLKNLLQASGKVQNMTNLQLANSALESFTILQDEMLFSPNDVIFMQFLCKEMGCKELYTRCIKYASNNKALCFFERPVENGCTNVQFHIQGDLTAYTKEQIKHIVEVVADILDCDIEEILVNGVRPSASFFLVLSVKEAYIWKLKVMNEHNHIRLIRLNIDFIIVDRTTIKLKRQKEADKVWEFPGNVGDYQALNHRKNMARPKDKFRSQTFGDAFLDKSERECSRLKLTLAKQMQKDIGRMLDEEIHSDLTIAVGNRTIQVHRFFIKTRSKRIYERFVELANAEPQSKLLTMPWWLDYDTLIILFHQLYNVNSVDGEIDEIDIAAGYTMVDYLLSLLSEKKPESVRRRMMRIRKEEEDMNGEETTDPLEESEVLTNGVQDLHNETVTRDEEVQNKVIPHVNGVEECNTLAEKVTLDGENDIQDNRCDKYDSDNTDILQKVAEEDTKLSDVDDVVEENPNLSELIKMSYDITVPYNTCSVLGEDLLRGFLQDLDYDCIITVSDVHFKAHRSLLTARSAYFEAMLSGSWVESDSHEIKLEGVTPGVMEQTLLYLYGGVTDLIDSCTLSELIMVADMYGLDGLRDVVLYNLRRDYCHFFHKPCSVCEEGVLITLCLTVTYNMAEMQERCTKWINNHRIKIWRTEAFARLPPEIIEICYNTAASSMDISNVIRVMMDCQRMNRTIPHLKHNETVLHYITLLMDSATEYTSQNFNRLINSPHFINLDKDLAFKIDLLEVLFESVIKSLSMKTACLAYVSLTKVYKNVTEGGEYYLCYAGENCNIGEKFISSLLKMSEAFLKMHIHQVINTENWDLLPKDFQTHLLATSNFVCVEGFSKSRKAPPKLTSMQEKSSPHSEKQGATQKSVTDKNLATSLTSVGGDSSRRQVTRPQKPLPKKTNQKLSSSSTKGGQLKQRLSPCGSVESISSRGSVSTRGSQSSTRASPTEFGPVVGNGILLADIPLEPVDDGVAQRAILPPSIHSIEQLQPILVWKQVTQNN